MYANQVEWKKREQYLQTLYVSPVLHSVLPDQVVGHRPFQSELQPLFELEKARLVSLNELLWRGAGTAFFNLRSARTQIELALESERDEIQKWLQVETSARYMFDDFADPDEPCFGLGVHEKELDRILFAETLRIVLRRMPENTFVLWTAYPVLAPGNPRWSERYDYAAHRPLEPWPAEFYYFLNCYLSVTAGYIGVDAVVQGVTDFFQQEPPGSVEALRKHIEARDPDALTVIDKLHLTYEFTARCLDETLPSHYIRDPSIFLHALQHALRSAGRASTTD